jgi:hypothetical protein
MRYLRLLLARQRLTREAATSKRMASPSESTLSGRAHV